MEMPPYRWPTLRQIGLRLYDRAKIFLRRAGTVILAVSIGLWVLSNLPFSGGHPPPIGHSVTGTVGRALEPLVRPLGFDWQLTVGIVTSFIAREVFVSTMSVLDMKTKPARLAAVLAIGFIGAFLINIVRLFGVFLAFEFLGSDIGNMVHVYLGYSLFIVWVLVFWSVAFRYLSPPPNKASEVLSTQPLTVRPQT
jgi:exosortase/archaeosortase family protein